MFWNNASAGTNHRYAVIGSEGIIITSMWIVSVSVSVLTFRLKLAKLLCSLAGPISSILGQCKIRWKGYVRVREVASELRGTSPLGSKGIRTLFIPVALLSVFSRALVYLVLGVIAVTAHMPVAAV